MKTKKILVGDKIKKIRKNLGIDQEMFVEILNNMGYKISCSAISLYEHNERRPNYEVLTAICRIGKVKPEWMLDFEDDNKPPTRAISSIASSKSMHYKHLYTG